MNQIYDYILTSNKTEVKSTQRFSSGRTAHQIKEIKMDTDRVREARRAYAELRKKLNEQIEQAGCVWNDASEHEIETVTSVGEAIRAYKRAPRGYPAKEKALVTWVDLCKNTNEVEFSYRSTYRSFFFFWDMSDGYCGYGMHKWMQLSAQVIHSSKTLEELFEADCQNHFPKESREALIKKALALCTESNQVGVVQFEFRIRNWWSFESLSFEKLMCDRRNELYEKETGKPHPYPDGI